VGGIHGSAGMPAARWSVFDDDAGIIHKCQFAIVHGLKRIPVFETDTRPRRFHDALFVNQVITPPKQNEGGEGGGAFRDQPVFLGAKDRVSRVVDCFVHVLSRWSVRVRI
jgi:hypothetical protein